MRSMAATLRSPEPSPRRPGNGGAIAMLAADIAAACNAGPQAMRPLIADALRRASADPDLVGPEHRVPDPDAYARHVLHSDPQGRFTILAIVWGPGQFSAPHAHHTWCAYAVQDGPLEETLYAFDPATMRARAVRTETRAVGYACFSTAGLDQIHRLGNSGAEPAVSIHVYGVEGARIGTGVNRMVTVTQDGRL